MIDWTCVGKKFKYGSLQVVGLDRRDLDILTIDMYSCLHSVYVPIKVLYSEEPGKYFVKREELFPMNPSAKRNLPEWW